MRGQRIAVGVRMPASASKADLGHHRRAVVRRSATARAVAETRVFALEDHALVPVQTAAERFRVKVKSTSR